jgi:phenylalanyl-tRNA synthetase beta subunit
LTINIENFIKDYHTKEINYQPLNNFMSIYKDVSFIVNNNSKVSPILAKLLELDFVESYQFIDKYKINEDEKSYMIRIKLINTANLKSADIENYLTKIIELFENNGIKVRKS